jgi:tetratricopeptide (TPR) repeat protein
MSSASRLAIAVALTLLAAPALADVVRGEAAYARRGDAAYARRADGALAGRADPRPIREAVRAYEAALAAEPDRLETRWKLLRALYFEGDFAAADAAAEQALFERATALADESLTRLSGRAGGPLAELSDGELRERLARAGIATSDAAALHFWSAVAWGAWSQSHGLLDAVREGVAQRIYEQARLAHRLDPDLEQGGSLRLLSRLHAKLPRVPLVSGFVDRRQAEPLAAETLRRWPEHPGNRLLLALTWLELEPARRREALALLGEVAATAPRASQRVEDSAVALAAQERLARERQTAQPASGG